MSDKCNSGPTQPIDANVEWSFVGPDLQIVDFARDLFEFAGDVGLQARVGKFDPQKYGCSTRWGLGYIAWRYRDRVYCKCG